MWSVIFAVSLQQPRFLLWLRRVKCKPLCTDALTIRLQPINVQVSRFAMAYFSKTGVASDDT